MNEGSGGGQKTNFTKTISDVFTSNRTRFDGATGDTWPTSSEENTVSHDVFLGSCVAVIESRLTGGFFDGKMHALQADRDWNNCHEMGDNSRAEF